MLVLRFNSMVGFFLEQDFFLAREGLLLFCIFAFKLYICANIWLSRDSTLWKTKHSSQDFVQFLWSSRNLQTRKNDVRFNVCASWKQTSLQIYKLAKNSDGDKVLLAYYFDLPDIIVRLIFYRDQLKFVKMEDFDQTALYYDLLFRTFPNIGNDKKHGLQSLFAFFAFL